MTTAVEEVVVGLSAGGIYALLALGIVLVHRTGGVVNVAQGELATLSAFVCWSLIDHGWAFWPAFGATVALSFAGGAVLEGALIRPLQGTRAATAVVLTAGLFLTANGLDRWIWGRAPRSLSSPFSAAAVHLGSLAFSKRELGMIGIALAAALVVGFVLRRTKLGLGLRAAAESPFEARHAGVRPEAMRAVSWGLAAALGAVAGVVAAPAFTLEPNMLRSALVAALAAAVLGGLDSALGAVLAGLAVGVTLELIQHYVHWIDGSLRSATALALLGLALLVRPAGLLGAARMRSA
jgi:branched-chain amino acid transport system permease protein